MTHSDHDAGPGRLDPSVSARSRMCLLLRYLDFRYLRRHWCGECEKPTVLSHPHRSLEHVLRDEWRQP